ncbi:TonB-dependent receptor [Myroides odoratimimus]|uniref:TonB-dependent receptor n=1 Tax=Myroides odoratimimus TaxID=76832 RepID=UPI001CE0EB0F|nr:TonB-dependent receptor [Myroides odoratimimus]MCA4807013.1 TonB-dependent receptor [Myroides odoratimimus]
MKRVLSTVFICLSLIGFAQQNNNCQVNGRVLDSNGTPIQGALVYLLQTNEFRSTDKSGAFKFENLACDQYHLQATFQDKQVLEFVNKLELNKVEDISLILGDSSEVLSDILIQTRSKKEILKNAAIKADIIDIKQNSQKANSIEELISRSPGVKVRNVGGLGSSSNIIVGGFTGNAVKFLYDDIPIDYLGSSYGLSKVPTNMINHIEVYKGVLPAKIGTDALGSAINIVPIKSNKTFSGVSYETGFYNTSIVTLNAHIGLTDKLFIGTNSFYNYSKNNFKVDNLPVFDSETGSTNYIRAKLFHNAFEQMNFQFYTQLKNLSWAELLELSINSYTLTKDIQNDAYSRARAFGEVYRKENGSFIPSLKYKNTFFNNQLSIEQFLVYSQINFELFDKAKNVYYNWHGIAQPSVSSSEMGNIVVENGYLINTLKQLTSRSYLSYLLNDNFQLESNTVYSKYNRESNISGSAKATYDKLITSFAIDGCLLDKKFKLNTQFKYLYAKLNTKVFMQEQVDQKGNINVSNNGYSFAQGIKYVFNQHHYLRASYENTYRLPDQEELFGDNSFIIANYELKPEKSNNLNLGYTYTGNRFKIELNTYYRDTKDLIRIKDLNQYQAVFLNLDHVRGFGLEIDGIYKPIDNLVLTSNLTWNDFRLQSSKDQSLNNQHYKNARVANMPFYYTNLGVSYNFKDLIPKLGDLSLYWNYSYMHQYYLDFIEKQFEPDGFLGLWGKSKVNTNRIIPVQHLNNLGFVYQSKTLKHSWAISGEIKNIFNTDIFNEFKMQSPGRNYRLKLTYNFN